MVITVRYCIAVNTAAARVFITHIYTHTYARWILLAIINQSRRVDKMRVLYNERHMKTEYFDYVCLVQ